MKRSFPMLAMSLLLLLLAGCNAQQNTKGFDTEAMDGLKKNAQVFTKTAIQKDLIPLNSYIKVSGRIEKTDSGAKQIKKGDRFILNDGKNKLQIFNEQSKSFAVGDEVVVYGEYYGFIKGQLIE